MYFKTHGLNFLVFGLLLTILSIDVYGQEKSPEQDETVISTVGLDRYEEVLDILFPRDAIASLPYGFVLRFQPSFASESQIVINNNFGNIEVIEYKSLEGNIYKRLNKLSEETKIDDAEELAKRIRVSRRVVNVSALITKRWRENLYIHLALAGNHENKLIKENMKAVPQATDGTSYLLWYTGNSDFSFQYNGGAEPDSSSSLNDNPIVNWMKQIRKEVSKLPTVSKQLVKASR